MSDVPQAATAERRARSQEWDDWWTGTLISDAGILSAIRDIAREAFFAGWEAAAPYLAAAERERIIMLASQLQAGIPADHPPGAQASFADYLSMESDHE